MKIPFNQAHVFENEFNYMRDSCERKVIRGDGPYTQKCHQWLEKKLPVQKALLTPSCTAALELAAILVNVGPGDEVIMPSYTFVSTANAFVLRGAKPVFVDIDPSSLNIDVDLIARAINKKTKGIVPVHYAGTSCDMDVLLKLAQEHNLFVVEDAAQAVDAFYKGRPLGTLGDLGTYSFHETKNVTCGEGGALLVNKQDYVKRAEIIREKGTNRSQFFRGEVDKYTWVDIGSSALPSDTTAAFLYSQFEHIDTIQKKRHELWNFYHGLFEEYEKKGFVKRPVIPAYCAHNAHMYYVLFNDLQSRTSFIDYCKAKDVSPVFHYIPLHSSPAGKKYGATFGELPVTDRISDTLLRMPFFYDLNEDNCSYIADIVRDYFKTK